VLLETYKKMGMRMGPKLSAMSYYVSSSINIELNGPEDNYVSTEIVTIMCPLR